MKCTCDDGKMKIVGEEYSDGVFIELPPVFITCIWCKGTGELTPAQHSEREHYFDAWCNCGNPSGNVDFYSHGHFHGYTCSDCGKIVQTG